MKANNGSGNNSSRDEWETPKSMFALLMKQYKFEFDCCSNIDNRLTTFHTDNFEKWYCIDHVAWMNPPFSKAKEMFIHFFKVVKNGVAIYRCDNFETKIWQDVIFPNSDWIFIPKGRVVYEGMNGNGSRFPSALIGVGVEKPKLIEGICLKNLELKLKES